MVHSIGYVVVVNAKYWVSIIDDENILPSGASTSLAKRECLFVWLTPGVLGLSGVDPQKWFVASVPK